MSANKYARILAALALGVLASACAANSQTPPAAAPLQALIGQNGLYVSGESYSAALNNISIIDTVYDDLTLQSAGTAVPPTSPASVAATTLADFTLKSPIWGQWFSYQEAQSTGAALRPVEPTILSKYFQAGGFFAETTQQTSDRAADTASTWAALQVIIGTHLPIPSATRTALVSWLSAQTTHISFPVQACQLTESLAALNATVPPALTAYGASWLTAHPATISDMDALANLYGATCAASYTLPRAISDGLASTVGPYLGGDSYTALQRYYLTRIWLALGQDRNRLGHLADSARVDLGPKGAAHPHTTFTGGLLPTYFAVRIEKTADKYLDTARIPAITKALASIKPASDPFDYLAGNAALCVLNACASGTSSGIAAAVARLPRTITTGSVDQYTTARDLLDILDHSYPRVTFESFDPTTPAGLHALVMTASGPPGGGFTQALPTITLVNGLRHGTIPFDDPTTRNAALDILAARHALDPTTAQAVRAALSRQGSCADLAGLSTIQIPGQAPECDLGATMESLESRQTLGAGP